MAGIGLGRDMHLTSQGLDLFIGGFLIGIRRVWRVALAPGASGQRVCQTEITVGGADAHSVQACVDEMRKLVKVTRTPPGSAAAC